MGPKPRKYGWQVINCVKASSHVMPSAALALALAFRTKIIINPKANTKQLSIFFSILFWIERLFVLSFISKKKERLLLSYKLMVPALFIEVGIVGL